MANKKIIIPVVALMLCAVAFTGLGFAYTGTFTGDSKEVSLDTHWVKVGAPTQFTIDGSTYAVDLDSTTTGFSAGTTQYSFSQTQHDGMSVVDGNLKITHVSIGKVKVTISDKATSEEKTGTVTVTPSSPGDITIAPNDTYSYDLTSKSEQEIEIFVDITIPPSVIANGNSTIRIPSFSVTVTAVSGSS